jgi:hypothetical protein
MTVPFDDDDAIVWKRDQGVNVSQESNSLPGGHLAYRVNGIVPPISRPKP